MEKFECERILEKKSVKFSVYSDILFMFYKWSLPEDYKVKLSH